ncbi:pseudouridylate synthase PUS7L-like isoform X2 [Brachyhypopomus gauderio]|uniref:pseudouridylate synthase PUS7L-like isoform X2 n=1 Tax=Brachyhypopomus gauderio TaxID=698409 RepID=UPI0040423B01
MLAGMERETPSLPCFMSDHEGFRGIIKTSTKDFVVTEIDIRGRVVNGPVSPKDPAIWTNAEVRGSSLKKCTNANLRTESTASDEVAVGMTSLKGDDVLSHDRFDLSVLLGSSANEALEQFTNGILECTGEQKVTEVSLGSFPDKHQRANVHRAVRHNFPFLMTVTEQAEIRVREDPAFRELSELVSEEEAEDFFRFIDVKTPGSVFTFLADDSKEHRTHVHHFMNRRFGKLVETKSFTDQKGTAITVRLRERGRGPKKRTAADSEEQVDTYTAFTLRKENLETLEAISYMAAALGVLPSDFSYAGIKDKRAITYQSMTVKKISPERLLKVAHEFERRGMQLSHIRSASEPLRLGRLQGNHFDLVIRDVRPHGKCSSTDLEKLVKEAVENVKTRGFVNYYGPQRFGNSQSIQADQVGLALLKEDMNTAVRLFLSPDEGDDLQNKAKRHFLHTGSAKESLALMPICRPRERLMLRALHRYGDGHHGCERAWLGLPHTARLFYLHAYCSRLWNEAAGHRLRALGPRPIQGDLVWVEPPLRAPPAGETHTPLVHVVTAAEERDNVFSLDQVVLPMPGNTVKYPENVVGEWYRDRLAQDDLGSSRFRINSLKLNVPGCYRPLLAFPHNITYMLQVEEPQVTGQSSPKHTSSLKLSFDLDASCYATVFVREVMKCEP